MDNGACSYRRYLNGDPQGIADIVEAYKDGLTLYLNGTVGNLAVAEELTEETFFRLFSKKPRFSGRSSFKSWLYAIGRNVAVDYIHHSARLPVTSLEEAENYLADQQDLERAYLREEDKISLHRAMAQLPEDYRTVLWLVYFEEFSNDEAAVALGKSRRQIRNLLYRAKQSLRITLEKEGFVYEEL